MEENKVTTLGDMIKQIINENQLSEVDEAEIQKMLEEKGKKKEEMGTCLAAVVERELEKAIKSGQICGSHAGLYQSVFQECFEKSEIASIPAAELSDILIMKFVLQVRKIYEGNKIKIKCFTGMLQAGMNKMAEEKILDFVPVKHAKEYIGSRNGIHYIYNIYTSEEAEKIKEYLELNFNDNRNVALRLWFAGNLSLVEIANLKKEDAYKGIFRQGEKAKLISKALELNPKNGNYVFMKINKESLEKITAQGLMMKLYHICNKLGIEYKMMNRNVAILYKEQ